MKLHPSNPTPGEANGVPEPHPVDIREIVGVLDLMLSAPLFAHREYYIDAAKRRLVDLRSRL